MEDGQDSTVTHRVQKFVGVPACGESASFGFTISNNAANQQIRIIERRAVSMRECVSQLAAFMDGARGFGRDMTRNATGKRELREQALHAVFALSDVGVDLRVSTLEIRVG